MEFKDFKNFREYDRKFVKVTNLSKDLKKSLKIEKLQEPIYGILYIDIECGVSLRILGDEKTEIKDVRMLKNSVKIIVEFVTQQINILRGADGKVIAGDENFIQKITDVWTFERTLNAKDNKWVLVSTKKMA